MKKHYVSMELLIFEVQTEKGYAATGDNFEEGGVLILDTW